MDNILLEIGGKEFYFDMDALSEAIKLNMKYAPQVENTESTKDCKSETLSQIDVAKYEMYRDLVGTLLSNNEIIDDKMGVMGLNSLSIPFKLSFNTLSMKGIIKEI